MPRGGHSDSEATGSQMLSHSDSVRRSASRRGSQAPSQSARRSAPLASECRIAGIPITVLPDELDIDVVEGVDEKRGVVEQESPRPCEGAGLAPEAAQRIRSAKTAFAKNVGCKRSSSASSSERSSAASRSSQRPACDFAHSPRGLKKQRGCACGAQSTTGTRSLSRMRREAASRI